MRILFLWVLAFFCLNLSAQESQDSLAFRPEAYVKAVSQQVEKLEGKVSKENQRVLRKWQRQHAKLLREISQVDSAAAQRLQQQIDQQAAKLQHSLQQPAEKLGQYLPSFDSLQSSFQFLESGQLATVKDRLDPKLLGAASDQLQSLKNQLAGAHSIEQLLKEQQQLLRGKLESLGMLRSLKAMNKTVYYYQAQISEYKTLLKDHKKAARKGLAALKKTRLFQDFMRRNSELASLFRLPGDPNDPNAAASLAGLQTRAQVNGLIQQQVASGGPNAAGQLRSNISQARSQLNTLKDKVLKLGGGSSDMAMPDGFRPNPYKVKKFWQRIELGANIQSQRARGWLPTRSDIGFSIGYQFRPTIIAGVGGSYRVGWGSDIRHISISHQGISLRSFVDVKLKGSFWLTGGYEQNQVEEVDASGNLKGNWVWQPSGLVGVSKVISLRSKLLKKTKLMLLWDFLRHQQKAPGQAIVLRVGYGF